LKQLSFAPAGALTLSNILPRVRLAHPGLFSTAPPERDRGDESFQTLTRLATIRSLLWSLTSFLFKKKRTKRKSACTPCHIVGTCCVYLLRYL